jgi:hypothetical protein
MWARKSVTINVVGKIIVNEIDCRGHWVKSDEDVRRKHAHSYMRFRTTVCLLGPTLRPISPALTPLHEED